MDGNNEEAGPGALQPPQAAVSASHDDDNSSEEDSDWEKPLSSRVKAKPAAKKGKAAKVIHRGIMVRSDSACAAGPHPIRRKRQQLRGR